MSAWVTLIILLSWAGAAGYRLRMVRPVRRLLDWAEAQLDGDGWDRRVRRYPAAVILGTALLLHPRKTRRAYLANWQRVRAVTEFTGAMRPAYNPDWHKTDTKEQP